ncbi:MAG: DUF1054 family protein [Sporolactobacillus sp.]
MALTRFSTNDFAVMRVPGLEARMQEIRQTVQPKLRAFASRLVPFLTETTGQPYYAHLAKHARRTVNPPDSTWIAFSCDPRGYKKYPHFQLGLWEDYLFFWLAMIDEYAGKAPLAHLMRVDEQISALPDTYCWSTDHTKKKLLNQAALDKPSRDALFQRLQTVKKADLLCGLTFTPEQLTNTDSASLLHTFEEAILQLMPLYNAAQAAIS